MVFLKLKGVSKVGLVALCGAVSAILGAFLNWILLPPIININIDKVCNWNYRHF